MVDPDFGRLAFWPPAAVMTAMMMRPVARNLNPQVLFGFEH
jgi:hypothetical protein